jgi:type IV secretion system protein VirB5
LIFNQEKLMTFRKYASSAVLALAALTATMPARAGIPVIDAAALTQQIQQVFAWLQQFQQMQDQFNKLQAQLTQMTTMTNKLDGARALGSILNDPTIKAALPPEMQNAAQLMLNPSALGTSQANINGILSSFGITGVNDLSSTKGVADAIGKAQAILTSAQQRQTQLTALASRVDGAADAKESMDLLNRNTLEVASINNQLIQTIASTEAAKRSQDLREAAELQDFAAKLRTGGSSAVRFFRTTPLAP